LRPLNYQETLDRIYAALKPIVGEGQVARTSPNWRTSRPVNYWAIVAQRSDGPFHEELWQHEQ
jgi:hypothetical protein